MEYRREQAALKSEKTRCKLRAKLVFQVGYQWEKFTQKKKSLKRQGKTSFFIVSHLNPTTPNWMCQSWLSLFFKLKSKSPRRFCYYLTSAQQQHFPSKNSSKSLTSPAHISLFQASVVQLLVGIIVSGLSTSNGWSLCWWSSGRLLQFQRYWQWTQNWLISSFRPCNCFLTAHFLPHERHICSSSNKHLSFTTNSWGLSSKKGAGVVI